MDINSVNVEAIVKQVLEGMLEKPAGASAPTAPGQIPATSKVAMLTALEHYDIKEYPIPDIVTTIFLLK